MPTLTAPRRQADVSLVAEHSFTRAREQHVQLVYVEPGVYRTHSKSGSDWYRVTATKFGNDVVIQCACKGGTFYRDDLGSSACKHAVGLAKRLIRRRDEVALLSQAAGDEYSAWLDGQRDAIIAEDALQPEDGWRLTEKGQQAIVALAAPAPTVSGPERHVCTYRPSNAICGRKATHWVRFPEGECSDQYACGKHADKLWMIWGSYRPGKGGVVLDLLRQACAAADSTAMAEVA
jgi:hypothetical protein